MKPLTEKERTALVAVMEWYLAPTDDSEKCSLVCDGRRDAAVRRALRKLKDGEST